MQKELSMVVVSELQFRSMTESDLDEVLKLEADGHAIPWTKDIFLDCLRVGYYCPVVETEGFYSVYAVLSAAAGEAHILNVCVDKSCRGQGLGRKTVLHLLKVAKAGDVQTMFLEVRPSNTIAIDLYESIGFIEVGSRKDYYPTTDGGREDALLMAMEIGILEN